MLLTTLLNKCIVEYGIKQCKTEKSSESDTWAKMSFNYKSDTHLVDIFIVLFIDIDSEVDATSQSTQFKPIDPSEIFEYTHLKGYSLVNSDSQIKNNVHNAVRRMIKTWLGNIECLPSQADIKKRDNMQKVIQIMPQLLIDYGTRKYGEVTESDQKRLKESIYKYLVSM